MKKIITILAIGLFISGCKSKVKKETDKDQAPSNTGSVNDAEPASKLEGAWEIKRAEGSMSETNVGTVYEFKGSKLSFGKGEYKNPGKTEVTDSTFSFQADGNELKFMYDYEISGDTLVVEMQNSGGQRFHMTKRK